MDFNALLRSPRRLGIALAAAAAVAFISLASPKGAVAQDDNGEQLNALYNRGAALAQQGNWEAALQIYAGIVKQYGKDAESSFGARFGVIYYEKGLCELNLKKYPEAVESFKTCYLKFPNGKKQDQDEGAPNINIHWHRAIFQCGVALQYSEDYETAIGLYKKFLEEKPEEDQIDYVAWNINMGICHGKTGKTKQAQEYLKAAQNYINKERSLSARSRYERALFNGVLALAEGWVGAEGETVTKEANEFLDSFDSALKVNAWNLSRYNLDQRLIKIAQDAAAAEKPILAIRLYRYLPSTYDILEALYVFSQNYATIPEALKTEIEKYKGSLWQDNHEVYALMGLAKCYEDVGDVRSGFATYGYLAENFPTSKFRANILFQATRHSALIGDMLSAQHYGLTFLDEFPDHEKEQMWIDLKPEVSALLLENLFYSGEYAQCIEIAENIRKNYTPGSKERDLPDVVLSGSMFYLGQFEAAQPELDAHVQNYPTSLWREMSLYHQAGNLVKLFRWTEAATKLDEFLAAYPESRYLDLALFDRATCYFALGDNPKTLELCARIEKEFPDSNVLDRALNLRGDVQQSEGQLAAAIESYQKAKNVAEANEHSEIAAYALNQLIVIAVTEMRNEDAAAGYDEFQQKFPDSFYEPFVVVDVLPALHAVGRTKEGLEKLEEIIKEIGKDPNSPNLEKAITSYANFYVEAQGAQAAVERLKNFPLEDLTNKTMRAWLTIARVDILEEATEESFPRKDAEIKVAYDNLMELGKESLPSYVLVKIGQRLVEQEQPFKAKEWFQELVDRPGTDDLKKFGLLGLAQVMAISNDEKVQEEAVQNFNRLIADYDDQKLVEDAYIGIAQVRYKQGNWAQAIDPLLKLINNKQFTKKRAELYFKLGHSYENLARASKKDEEWNNALTAYLMVWTQYAGELEFSGHAYYNAAKAQVDRGNREKAYEILKDMEPRLGAHENHPRDPERWIRKGLGLLAELKPEFDKPEKK
ncbi:MAG: tetratricopeptide repeat protein [Verrucomicrobiales bacterium]